MPRAESELQIQKTRKKNPRNKSNGIRPIGIYKIKQCEIDCIGCNSVNTAGDYKPQKLYFHLNSFTSKF